MATRPSRPSYVHWGTWLLILGLIGILIGCGRKEAPPAIAEEPKAIEGENKLDNAVERLAAGTDSTPYLNAENPPDGKMSGMNRTGPTERRPRFQEDDGPVGRG